MFNMLLVDFNEYEKLLDIDLKEFTNDLKNLTSECLQDPLQTPRFIAQRT